jgi:hypothetical protein
MTSGEGLCRSWTRPLRTQRRKRLLCSRTTKLHLKIPCNTGTCTPFLSENQQVHSQTANTLCFGSIAPSWRGHFTQAGPEVCYVVCYCFVYISRYIHIAWPPERLIAKDAVLLGTGVWTKLVFFLTAFSRVVATPTNIQTIHINFGT